MANTYIKEFEDCLLMGSWQVDTACKILAGFFPTIIEAGVYSYSADQLQQISNGKAPTDAQQKEYRRIYALFKSDQHNWTDAGADGKLLFPQSNLNIMKSTVRPCYAIDWAASKRIQPAWLDEARKEGFQVDMPQSEPVKELEQHNIEEELGETKEENLYRLIGILKDMLADEEVIDQLKRDPKTFSKQKELINYISGLYGEDHPNKGLEKTNLNETMSRANKVLKSDKEP